MSSRRSRWFLFCLSVLSIAIAIECSAKMPRILNCKETDHFTSFLLSESSLLVPELLLFFWFLALESWGGQNSQGITPSYLHHFELQIIHLIAFICDVLARVARIIALRMHWKLSSSSSPGFQLWGLFSEGPSAQSSWRLPDWSLSLWWGHHQDLWQHCPVKSGPEASGHRQRTRQNCRCHVPSHATAYPLKTAMDNPDNPPFWIFIGHCEVIFSRSPCHVPPLWRPQASNASGCATRARTS